MNAIAKISWYLERSVVTLKLRKECLNTVTRNTPVLLRIKYWTIWYIDRYSISTYTGVTNFQKTVRFFGPTLYLYVFVNTLFSSLNTMLIADKHCCDVCCDKLPVPQIDRKSKQVKEQWHGKFYFAASMENNSLF